MIKGLHAMFYSMYAEELRIFFRDKLNFPYTDVGDGWLIFDMPEADLGCHPVDESGKEGVPAGIADISFYCDDIHKTVMELKERGVEFEGEIQNHGYGWVTFMKAPGNLSLQLYQPLYEKI